MNDLLVFGLVPALAVILPLLSILLHRVKRFQGIWPRRIGVMLTSLFGAVLLLPLAWLSFAQLDEGGWSCKVCGKRVEQRRYLDMVVSSRSLEPAMNAYASWFQRVTPFEHGHDWMPVGCHMSASGAAYLSGNPMWRLHASLPLVPDEELARALVRSLADADPDRRRSMLADFDRGWQGGPFVALVEGEIPSRETFRAAHAVWIDAHPLWR